MTINSDTLTHEIRQEFTKLLDYVTNEAAQQATAYEIERWAVSRVAEIRSTVVVLVLCEPS